MSFYFFKSLPNGEYSNLLIAAAFSNKYFSHKTSLPVNNNDDNDNRKLSSLSV